MHNITSNKEKYHFFIGNILDNEEQVRMLKNIQKKLVKKFLHNTDVICASNVICHIPDLKNLIESYLDTEFSAQKIFPSRISM